MGSISLEAAIGIGSLIVLPFILWCISVNRGVKRLLTMHNNPDDYGFGTVETNRILEKQEGYWRELIHYIKFIAEQSANGKKVPPPTPHVD